MVHHPSGAARGQVGQHTPRLGDSMHGGRAARIEGPPQRGQLPQPAALPRLIALLAASGLVPTSCRLHPLSSPPTPPPPTSPQASDINREAKELLRIRDYLDSILAQATGQPFDKVRRGRLALLEGW